MNRIIFYIALVLCSVNANAQNFLDSLRKIEQGKGKVTVVQTPAIDSLVNGTGQKNILTEEIDSPSVDKNNPAHIQNNEHEKRDNTSSMNNSHEGNTTSTTNMDETVVDTRKKVMRNSYKMHGYRVQVFSGGNSRSDRKKAETAGTIMKRNFPNEPIYVHFYSPSWKCRMGNYKTIEEAREILGQVKKLGYNQACIVKGTISVQY